MCISAFTSSHYLGFLNWKDGNVTLLTTADLQAAGYRDSSGVRVSLARAQAQRSNAWSLEFMAYNMLIPPGARGLEYSNRLPSDMMQKILGPEFRHANGTLRLWQVHAHAHGHARRVELPRERDGVSETLYAIEPYCGVGDCQHFHDLPHTESDGGPPTLRPGDSLEFRCTYDNDGRFEIGYGVSAMQEMCGPILIYTPHDLDYHGQTWYEHVGGMVRDGRGQGPWALSGFHRPTRLDFPEHVINPKTKNIYDSLKYGFLFGIIIFGIYDFTAASVFNNWDISLAIYDILWGGILYFISSYSIKFI